MRPVFDHTVISNGTNQTILSPFSKKTEWYSPVTIERAIQYPRWINIVKKKKSILDDKNSNILERKPRRSDPCEW